MDIKLIALDLDGTLLRSDKTISGYTLSVLDKCRAKGILTAIATARSQFASQEYITAIKPDIVISCGGALVTQNEKVIFKSIIPVDMSISLIADLCAAEGIGAITAETDKGYFVSYSEWDGSPGYAHGVYYDFIKPLDTDTYKVTVEIFDSDTLTMLKNKYSDCSIIGFSGEDWYRFSCKNANKADAVVNISQALNIPIENVAGFGDDYIDIDMLTACGVGVCMENGAPEVKVAADCICDTNDNDGVAKWLEANVL